MIRIGIVGCGKIAQVRHIPEYRDNPNAEIAGFYDINQERAAELAGEYGARAYASAEAMFADESIDAVSICAANVFHAPLSIAALKAGKDVLCEKPMAVTMEECEKMVETAEKTGKLLMIGHNQRLTRAHVKAKELLDQGEIGRVITARSTFGHGGPETWSIDAGKQTWFFDRKQASAGALADLGVHKTDLLYYLTGQKVVKTAAVLATVDKRYPDGSLIAVDDNALALYTLESGVVGTMSVSWTNYGQEDNSTKLYCQGGVIRMYDDPKYSLIVEKKDGSVIPYELDQLTSNKDQTSGGRTSTGVIDAFVESIVNDHEPMISGKSALHAMHVIFANQRSAESGKTEPVEE